MVDMEQLKRNAESPNLGEWPTWFRNIITRHPGAFSGRVHALGRRGDVIVGWRRGAQLHTQWSRTSPYSMLILGDVRPPAVELGAGNIGVESGPIGHFWLSYIQFNTWVVVAEGSRGKLRPWGNFIPYSADLAKYVIYKNRS